MKASEVFSPVIWNTCILLNSHSFLTSWVADEHWCFWNTQPMFVVTHTARAHAYTRSPCSWLHTQPVLVVAHTACAHGYTCGCGSGEPGRLAGWQGVSTAADSLIISVWIHYSGCPGKISFLGNQSEYIDDQYKLPENICMHALQCICEGTGTEAEHRP